MITIFIKSFVVLAIIFSMASLSVRAANDVQISASTNFSLVTSDTAAAAAIVANNGGQAVNLEIQSNHIDITLENLSNITFNAVTAGQYLKITKLSGSNDYAISPACVTTSAVLTGSGATVILRLEVITSNSCVVTPPPTPPSGGGGGSGVYIPPPANIFVKINNGALQATSSAVTLTLGVNNALSVLISNYPNFSGSNWEPYTPTKYWTLLPGAGNRSVYVKFRGSGGEAPGTFSATINVAAAAITPENLPVIQPVEAAASTTCPIYLTKNISLSAINDANEVKKLQTFLRDLEGFSDLKVTGIYDTATFNATKSFQSRYAEDILEPWGFESPTGMVNKTTIKKINELYCLKTAAPAPIIIATSTPSIIAATSSPAVSAASLSPYLTKNIIFNAVNDTNEVKKLQTFLRDFEGFGGLKVTGIYDVASVAAIRLFQAKYAQDILVPAGMKNPTGNVYQMTINKINSIVAASGKNPSAGEAATEACTTASCTGSDLSLAGRLKGRILLQVEERGEAYYIYPDDLKKYYLGTPDDAFRVMRALGLGANNKFLTSYQIYPARVAGKILINVEDAGKAYYISPLDRKAYYLGSPEQAYQVIRSLGLGITNNNLDKIAAGVLSK